jgi:hypothetical protein
MARPRIHSFGDVQVELDDIRGIALNVTDFGAKWDGTTDDLTATQAAINAVSAAGGGIVQLPPGTGLWSSSPTLQSGVWLRGSGKYATTVKLKNGANVTVLYSGNLSNAIVSDLTIDGNRANQTAGTSDGISFGVCSNITIFNVVVKNCRTRGIAFDNVDDSLITACQVSSCGSIAAGSLASIEVKNGSDRVRIIGNTVDTPFWHGIGCGGTGCVVANNVVRKTGDQEAICIATSSSTDTLVQGNYCFSSMTGGNCIDIGDSVNCTIEANVCVGGRTGIDWDSATTVDRGNRNSIVGNICHGCAIYGIAAAGANVAGNGLDATIVGNMVSFCGGGIALDSIQNGVIAHNTVKNSLNGGSSGILLASTNKASSGLVVSGNRCYDDQGTKTQANGIKTQGSCTNNTFIGNDVNGNLTIGMSLVGTNIVRYNTGYVTENNGVASKQNASTIAHGLAATPTKVILTPSVAKRLASVTAKDATNLTISLHDDTGAAIAVNENIYWAAEV